MLENNKNGIKIEIQYFNLYSQKIFFKQKYIKGIKYTYKNTSKVYNGKIRTKINFSTCLI